MDRRIIIAAGHGGKAPGAIARGRKEYSECIDIVNRIAAKVRADGRIALVVVPHDLDYVASIAWVNRRFGENAGYAVEVHKNAGPPGATGVEAWYETGNSEAAKRAETVLRDLTRVSRLKSRGIKKDSDYHGGRLAWCRNLKPLSGLYECGFITHDHFNNELYAEGMFRGLLAMFGLKEPVAQIYRVIAHDGRQIGAYRVRSNAWRAFLTVSGGATIRNREGRDVTAEFADEFGGHRFEGMREPGPTPEDAAVDGVALEHEDTGEELPELEPEDVEDEEFTVDAGDDEDAGTGMRTSDEVAAEAEAEHDCEDHAHEVLDGPGEAVDIETTLSPEEEADLDAMLAEVFSEAEGGPEDDTETIDTAPEVLRRAGGGLGPAGGGWGGSQAPVQRAMRVGTRNGLTITSTKRSSLSTGSDHHVSQRRAYAADMSNGSKPTPQMDKTARQIAAMLGRPGWRGGFLEVYVRNYRVQLLYRTNIGGNHFNHVHVGVKMR